MEKIIITIETDNAAFEGARRDLEVAQILKKLSNSFESDITPINTIIDINGNRCGSVVVE